MIILSADTSTSQGSVAVRNREGVVIRESLAGDRPHSETLLPVVKRVLYKAGYSRDDVQAVAVGTGPGAFTGLRVGLATFKAWAAARGLPIIPVVSMDAVAFPHLREGSGVAVLADARKGEVYAAYYPSLDEASLPLRQGDVTLMSHEAVPGWLSSLGSVEISLAGNGLSHLLEKGFLRNEDKIVPGPGTPDALWILSLAEVLLPMGHTVGPSGLVPVYVRPPDAKKPSPDTIIAGAPGGQRDAKG